MTTIRVEQAVAAPPEVVWSLVSDITRMGEWSPEAEAGAWSGGATGPAVGARFTGRNDNGGKRWSTTCTVTECEPGRVFAFAVTSSGLKVATWRYDLVPTESGCTVAEAWEDQRGWLVRTVGARLTGVRDREAHNRAGMEETLRRLAAAAEASATP